MRVFFFAAAVIVRLTHFTATAQTTYPVNSNQDILHYTFNITLNDSTDEISGLATVLFTLKDGDELVLDLLNKNADGKGMKVDKITLEGKDIGFKHEIDRLTVYLESYAKTPIEISIKYTGICVTGPAKLWVACMSTSMVPRSCRFASATSPRSPVACAC